MRHDRSRPRAGAAAPWTLLRWDGSMSSFYARTPRRDTARARFGPPIGVVDAIGDIVPAPPK